MKQTKKEQIALLFSFLSITDVGHERFINVFVLFILSVDYQKHYNNFLIYIGIYHIIYNKT